MNKYTPEDIIRMQFADIFGHLKNAAITASQMHNVVNEITRS